MVSNILQNGKIIKTKTFLGSSIFIFQQEVHNIVSQKKKEDEGQDKKDKKLAPEIKII